MLYRERGDGPRKRTGGEANFSRLPSMQHKRPRNRVSDEEGGKLRSQKLVRRREYLGESERETYRVEKR